MVTSCWRRSCFPTASTTTTPPGSASTNNHCKPLGRHQDGTRVLLLKSNRARNGQRRGGPANAKARSAPDQCWVFLPLQTRRPPTTRSERERESERDRERRRSRSGRLVFHINAKQVLLTDVGKNSNSWLIQNRKGTSLAAHYIHIRALEKW